MTFNILSIRDFVEDSKEWTTEHFIANTVVLKEELKTLDVYDEANPYYGCRREIEALVRFLRNILFFNETGGKYPATATQEEFELIREIIRRYVPEKLD